jgi:hypothetical protein
MKTVVCINDKNLPAGARVVKDKEYIVTDEFINNYDQRVYILEGISNEGTTKMGLRWIGYDANRFAEPESTQQVLEEQKYEYA